MIPQHPRNEARQCIDIGPMSLTLGNTEVFREFSASFAVGRFTCILGRSGVGKSTLLRCIAGLSGVGEIPMRENLAHRVAWLGQGSDLLPWKTVLDNVCLGAALRGEASPEEEAIALLRRVGLEGYAHERPSALSGGMQQRVALVRTLLEPRDLVLMDEPFSGLDALTRLQMQSLVVELLQGRTVLCVTHDPLEALRIADEIAVLEGRPAHLQWIDVPSGDRPRTLSEAASSEATEAVMRLLMPMEATL